VNKSQETDYLSQVCQNWVEAGLLPCRKTDSGLGDDFFFFQLDETFLPEISMYQSHIEIYSALSQPFSRDRPYQQLTYLHEKHINSRHKTTTKALHLETIHTLHFQQ